MRLFTHTTFTGHYPVGTSAMMLAESPERAIENLNIELKESGLDGDAEVDDLQEHDLCSELVVILQNGDY